jgi:oligopeptidase B
VLKEEWDEWEILLDANQRAAKSEFYTLGGLGIAPNNQLMAVAEDYLSRRQYGLRFCDLSNGEWYPEILENVTSGFAWSNDSRFVWYVRKHPTTLLLIRSGATPSGRRRRATCWSTRKKMRPSTSACIKPPPSSSW